MTTIFTAARSLFDLDSEGDVTNEADVHPEYIRAVVDLVSRKIGADNDNGRLLVRQALGLSEQTYKPVVGVTNDPSLPLKGFPAGNPSHRVVTWTKGARDDNNPLHPFNGSLAKTLDTYASEGWVLVSYDWSSWRHMLIKRVDS